VSAETEVNYLICPRQPESLYRIWSLTMDRTYPKIR
jgi:hypothetical protein